MLLAGDIGGTKTELAIFSEAKGPYEPLAKATFPSKEYSDLNTIVQEFLAQVGSEIHKACFGVAAPVTGDRVNVTNLPWVIDGKTLQKELGLASVSVLNDLTAVANAVPLLEPEQLHTLKEGTPVPHGPLAVIAPGTGLGEVFLTWDGERYRPHDCEGGHTDFAPGSPSQLQLLRYLWSRFDHVNWKRVCSGVGIPNIYDCYRNGGYAKEPTWLAERLAEVDDPTPVIVNAALEEKNELCTLTLDSFVSILGAEAGNLMLTTMATGGVYLGGGIPPRILPVLEQGSFLRAFSHKGRVSDVLKRVPIHVIMEPEVALLGAASYGLGL